MSTPIHHDRPNVEWAERRPASAERSVRRHPRAFMAFGVATGVLGVAAVLFPFVATVAVELILGGVILASGLAQIGYALQIRTARGWGALLFTGILSAVVGALLLAFPRTGILSLTFVFAAMFLVGGAFRAFTAARLRPRAGWGWLLASGLLGVTLGLLVLTQWPAAAGWFLGLLLGVDLIFGGASLFAWGRHARDLERDEDRRAEHTGIVGPPR